MVIKHDSELLNQWMFHWFCPSFYSTLMNYVEYLSAVKFNYTIRQYQFRSTDYQAMLHVVQSVCKKSISN